MPTCTAGRQCIEVVSAEYEPTLPFTHITGGTRANSGVQKVPMASKFLKGMEREMGFEPATQLG